MLSSIAVSIVFVHFEGDVGGALFREVFVSDRFGESFGGPGSGNNLRGR